MDLVEYGFGTGTGDPHVWVSEADLDLGEPGRMDAVALDFDGDGWADDALWDSDGDARADVSVLDVGSGRARYFTDPGGAGTWAVECPAPPGAAAPGLVDLRGDGSADDAVVGSDRDHRTDAVLAPTDSGFELLVDTDADGVLDLRLVDADGDGRLDTRAPSVTGA
ncbi:hypothetical protein GCM10023094_39350 [Rhodococcus olei]|uniref:Pullulanase n=1 Tax=Rhodococcus olei TaxID=2161675 RepID=A0ABP8PC49_9NOCA